MTARALWKDVCETRDNINELAEAIIRLRVIEFDCVELVELIVQHDNLKDKESDLVAMMTRIADKLFVDSSTCRDCRRGELGHVKV